MLPRLSRFANTIASTTAKSTGTTILPKISLIINADDLGGKTEPDPGVLQVTDKHRAGEFSMHR